MEENKAQAIEAAQDKKPDLITEERLHELLSILLPYGYSHYEDSKYTGVSPYIGKTHNIITIVANDPYWSDGVFSICMDRFDEDEDEANSLGFYKGIMKVIAPELYCDGNKFKEECNVLDFVWADDITQENAFPVEVKYKPF